MFTISLPNPTTQRNLINIALLTFEDLTNN